MSKKQIYLRTASILLQDINLYLKALRENKAKLPVESEAELHKIETLTQNFANLIVKMMIQNDERNLKKSKAVSQLQFYKSYIGITKTLNKNIDLIISAAINNDMNKTWQRVLNTYMYSITVFNFIETQNY